jgi:hypothetical protein
MAELPGATPKEKKTEEPGAVEGGGGGGGAGCNDFTVALGFFRILLAPRRAAAASLASCFMPPAVERDRHQSTACRLCSCNKQLKSKHLLLHTTFYTGQN